MDFISTALVSLDAPTGFWEKILNSFKGALGTYILAVILLAVIVRVVFSIVDIVSKKANMKTMAMNAKMKPELDAIQKKYGHDPKLLQQKQGEIYKKYQFNMMGSCLPMLVMMILQTVVFISLWGSLQSVSNYNIANNYSNMKDVYANIISLNENTSVVDMYNDGDELTISIDIDKNKIEIKNVTTGEVASGIYTHIENETICNLIKKYVNADDSEYAPTSVSEALKTIAEEKSSKYYLDNQEGFLWIKNVYKAESPASPLFTKKEILSYMSKYYDEDAVETEKAYEDTIFDYVVGNGIAKQELGSNGYYILTILAVLVSFLSIWLSNKMMAGKNKAVQQQSNKMMYIVMPLIMGLFTFMYTSLFAIYIIVGQMVMVVLTPLTTFIVRKWNNYDDKKNKDKNIIEVDYRRKDI